MLPLIVGAAVLGGVWLIFGGKNSSSDGTTPKGVLTPEHEVILATALSSVDDPNQLGNLVDAFTQQELPAQAAQIQQKIDNLPNAPSVQDQAAAAFAAQQSAHEQELRDQAIASAAADLKAQTDANTAVAAAQALADNAATALAAQQADQAAQDEAAKAFAAAQDDPSQTIGDQNALGQLSGPKVSIQEQINSATESGGGILIAVVKNIPSIQMVLNSTQGLNLDVDGKKGPMTTQAIKDFQTKSGLQVDGDPGPATVKALNAALGV